MYIQVGAGLIVVLQSFAGQPFVPNVSICATLCGPGIRGTQEGKEEEEKKIFCVFFIFLSDLRTWRDLNLSLVSWILAF